MQIARALPVHRAFCWRAHLARNPQCWFALGDSFAAAGPELAASGKIRRLCWFCRSAILGVYEKHTRKERERVPGFTGVAVENIRGLAVGDPDQPACDSKPQVESKDFQEIKGGRGVY